MGLSMLHLGLWQGKQTVARPVKEESNLPNSQEMQEGPGSYNAPGDCIYTTYICIYTYTQHIMYVCIHTYMNKLDYFIYEICPHKIL